MTHIHTHVYIYMNALIHTHARTHTHTEGGSEGGLYTLLKKPIKESLTLLQEMYASQCGVLPLLSL